MGATGRKREQVATDASRTPSIIGSRFDRTLSIDAHTNPASGTASNLPPESATILPSVVRHLYSPLCHPPLSFGLEVPSETLSTSGHHRVRMDVQDFEPGRLSSSWRPEVGNRWCLGRVSSSSETTATPAQRQIDGLTSSAKGSDGPGLDCWGCGERGTARQDDHPRNPFASRPSRFLYHLRGRGGCEKIWFRPRVVFDRRETSGNIA